MSKLTITIEITSTAQLQALESALELFSDMENDRLQDEEKIERTPGGKLTGQLKAQALRDRAIQRAAVELLASVRGGK